MIPKGGHFVLHAKALHGNPFDGHTLGPLVADMERLTGVTARRIHVDKAIVATRTRIAPGSGSAARSAAIRREMKRRAAVEPVIGHLKDGHHLGRNHLKGREGDRINAVLAAVGYNFPSPRSLAGDDFARLDRGVLGAPYAVPPA